MSSEALLANDHLDDGNNVLHNNKTDTSASTENESFFSHLITQSCQRNSALLLAQQEGQHNNTDDYMGLDHPNGHDTTLDYSTTNVPTTAASTIPPECSLSSSVTTLATTTTKSFHETSRILYKLMLQRIVASALIGLAWVFLWMAYFTDDWCETHIQMNIGWQDKYLPSFLHGIADVNVKTTGLISTTHSFQSSNQPQLTAYLWFSYIVMPCLLIILLPMYVSNYTGAKKTMIWNILETMSIRIVFFIYFILILLDIGTSYIQMDWVHSYIQVYNIPKTAFISFTLAISCLMMTVILLRIPFASGCCGNQSDDSVTTTTTTTLQANKETTELLLSQQQQQQQKEQVQTTSNNTTTPTAGTSAAEVEMTTTTTITETTTALTTTEGTTLAATDNSNNHDTKNDPPLSFCKKLILLQLGFMTCIMIYPAMRYKLFSISYNGFIAEYVNDEYQRFSVQLHQILPLLFEVTETKEAYRVPYVVITILSTPLILTCYLLPVVLILLGFACVLFPNHKRTKCMMKIITCLHPAACGMILSTCCITIMPSIHTIALHLLDADKWQTCQHILQYTQLDCILVNGTVHNGAYYLLLQSILMDLWLFCLQAWMT